MVVGLISSLDGIDNFQASNAMCNPSYGGVLRVPNSIAGPMTLKYANDTRDELLEALEKEAEQLKRVSYCRHLIN